MTGIGMPLFIFTSQSPLRQQKIEGRFPVARKRDRERAARRREFPAGGSALSRDQSLPADHALVLCSGTGRSTARANRAWRGPRLYPNSAENRAPSDKAGAGFPFTEGRSTEMFGSSACKLRFRSWMGQFSAGVL